MKIFLIAVTLLLPLASQAEITHYMSSYKRAVELCGGASKVASVETGKGTAYYCRYSAPDAGGASDDASEDEGSEE